MFTLAFLGPDITTEAWNGTHFSFPVDLTSGIKVFGFDCKPNCSSSTLAASGAGQCFSFTLLGAGEVELFSPQALTFGTGAGANLALDFSFFSGFELSFVVSSSFSLTSSSVVAEESSTSSVVVVWSNLNPLVGEAPATGAAVVLVTPAAALA